MMNTGRALVEVQVESSSLRAIGYVSQTQHLHIIFRNGRGYRYFGVPNQIYQALVGAESKGRYFNAAIKPAFACERLS